MTDPIEDLWNNGYQNGYAAAVIAAAAGEQQAEKEITLLRHKLQAAESALSLLLTAAELALPQVILQDDAATQRLAELVQQLNDGLPEPPEEDQGTPICTRCHRPLVVPQVLDHIETPTGWVCMLCI